MAPRSGGGKAIAAVRAARASAEGDCRDGIADGVRRDGPGSAHEPDLGALGARADRGVAGQQQPVRDRPGGITGEMKLSGSTSLVAQTGGEAFYNSNKFEQHVERI